MDCGVFSAARDLAEDVGAKALELTYISRMEG
jgi:hypothetical protein